MIALYHKRYIMDKKCILITEFISLNKRVTIIIIAKIEKLLQYAIINEYKQFTLLKDR